MGEDRKFEDGQAVRVAGSGLLSFDEDAMLGAPIDGALGTIRSLHIADYYGNELYAVDLPGHPAPLGNSVGWMLLDDELVAA